MKTFVLMTKLAPQHSEPVDVANKMKDRSTGGQAWLAEVKEKCPEVKFLAHYALLGTYDFMDIYEAPDEETAARVSLISRSNGAFQVESWCAIPRHRLSSIAKGI